MINNVNNNQPQVNYPPCDKRKPKTAEEVKVGAWLGVMPLDNTPDMPKTRPWQVYNPSHWNFWAPGFENLGIWAPRATYRQFEYSWLGEKSSLKALFESTLGNFSSSVGKPDVLMGYLDWYNGWDYQDFPSLFCDLCYDKGITPIITWQPNFKRTAPSKYFLDEFNEQMADKKSELYRYAVNFAKKAASYDRPIYLRPFHEMNIGFGAYGWTGFQNGGNIEATQKFQTAWRSLRQIFRDAGATNVKFVWCPEANPDTEGLPQLGESWNNIENYYPGNENVDLVGFDIYQRPDKPADRGFIQLFGLDRGGKIRPNSMADFIINRHPEMPVGICETSSPEDSDVRERFINELFATSRQYGLEFVAWFNESKSDGVWSLYQGTLAAKSRADQAAEVDAVLSRGETGNPSAASPKMPVSITDNNGIKAFRANIGSKAAGADPANYVPDATSFERKLKLAEGSAPSSYNVAMENWRNQRESGIRGSKIGWFDFLRRINPDWTNWLGFRPLGNAPEARLKTARTYFDRWLLVRPLPPYNHDESKKADFQIALDLLDENTEKALRFRPEFLTSIVEKQKILSRYSVIFGDIARDTSAGAQKGTAPKLDHIPDVEAYAWQSLHLLGGKNYVGALRETLGWFAEIAGYQDVVDQKYLIGSKDKKGFFENKRIALVMEADLLLKEMDALIKEKAELSNKDDEGSRKRLEAVKMRLRAVKDRLELIPILERFCTELQNEAAKVENKELVDQALIQVITNKNYNELTALIDRWYTKEVNRRKMKYSQEELIGIEAGVLVTLGDVYMVSSIDSGTGEARPRDLERAKVFYQFARLKISEKTNWADEREFYWNHAARIGMARVFGEGDTREAFDVARKYFEDVISVEDRIDPVLKVQATYYLAEMLYNHSTRIVNNLFTPAEREKLFVQAYGLFKSLANTEMSYKVSERIKVMEKAKTAAEVTRQMKEAQDKGAVK